LTSLISLPIDESILSQYLVQKINSVQHQYLRDLEPQYSSRSVVNSAKYYCDLTLALLAIKVIYPSSFFGAWGFLWGEGRLDVV
jgi:hypothetical protein